MRAAVAKREGGQIFGSASAAAVCIFVLVKKPTATGQAQIHFHDVGDYLSLEEKLAQIGRLGSVAGITDTIGWQIVKPDAHGDWFKQRDDTVTEYPVLGDKKRTQLTLFANFSLGVVTNRDAWCYSSSKRRVVANMTE